MKRKAKISLLLFHTIPTSILYLLSKITQLNIPDASCLHLVKQSVSYKEDSYTKESTKLKCHD